MAVRRESVRLSLEDDFSRGMLAAAAATKTLEGALGDLDGTTVDSSKSTRDHTKSTKEYTLATAIADEKVARLRKSLREQARATLDADRATVLVTRDTDRLSVAAVRGERSIDKYSGRMGILLKVAGVLGPALVPIGAVGIAGVAGLANQFGFAAVAAGTAIIAFQGVGTALTAVNKAALEPTVANLDAARQALNQLSPAGRAMVSQLSEMRPIFDDLRDTAAEGLFPGMIQGFEDLERLAPSVDAILSSVSSTLGEIFAGGAESLASSRWADFFAMLALDARPVLMDMASAIGDVTHGMSEMWEAFQPLNKSFGSWLADGADAFDKWATGLSKTEGFQEFVDYIRTNGPKLADATQAIANALLQIVEAAAPLGGPVLDAIAGIANAIATIADSPLGTPIMAAVTALSAMSLAANIATASVTRLNAALATTGAGAGKFGAVAAGPAGVAGLVGLLNVPDYIDNLELMIDGERGVVEGLARMAAAGTPTGAVMQALGVDILGTADKSLAPFAMEAIQAAKASAELRNATHQVRISALRAQSPFDGLNRVLARQREAAIEGARGFRDLSSAMKPKNFDLGKWIHQLEEQARAMREFRINAQQAAEKGLRRGLIAELQKLGPEGAVQLKHLADASVKEIGRANDAWRSLQGETRKSRQEIHATGEEIDRVGGKTAKPKIDVQSNASDVVAQANNALMGINGTTAHTYVITHYQRQRAEAHVPLASGGTVPGQRLPYGDRTPIMAAPGEEVISNRFGQADRHRALLKAINAGHYANGGTIRSERGTGSSRSLTINVTAGDIRGSIDSPWGKVDLRGMMRAEAQDIYDQNRTFEGTQGG